MGAKGRSRSCVLNLVKKRIPTVMVGLLLTGLYTAAVFFSPLASEYLIDEVLPAPSLEYVYRGIAVFAAVCFSQPVFGFLKDLTFLFISENVVCDLRKLLYERLILFKLDAFEENGSGDYISRLTNDVRQISSFITNVLSVLLKDVLLVVLILVGMCLQSVAITGVLLAILIGYFTINYLIAGVFEKLSKKNLENYDQLCDFLTKTWDNYVLVRVSDLNGHYINKFIKLVCKTRETNMDVGKWSALSSGLSGFIIVAALSIIYGLGVLGIRDGSMSLGSVVALGLYFQLLSTPIQELNSAMVHYKRALPSFERLSEWLDVPLETPGLPSTDMRDNALCVGLVLNQSSFDYCSKDGKTTILDKVSLTFPDRGLCALSGQSGCGKSTFFKLVVGLYELSEGEIVVYGKKGEVCDRRMACLYVAQEAQMLSGETLLFNLLLRESDDSDLIHIEQLIDSLGLRMLVNHLPNGYETVISETLCFSGGERRRLAFVRALLSDKPILLLDEITAGLDQQYARIVVSLLRACSQRKLVFEYLPLLIPSDIAI